MFVGGPKAKVRGLCVALGYLPSFLQCASIHTDMPHHAPHACMVLLHARAEQSCAQSAKHRPAFALRPRARTGRAHKELRTAQQRTAQAGTYLPASPAMPTPTVLTALPP